MVERWPEYSIHRGKACATERRTAERIAAEFNQLTDQVHWVADPVVTSVGS